MVLLTVGRASHPNELNGQAHTDMLTGQPHLDNPTPRLTAKVILDCLKMTMTIDHHPLISPFTPINQLN